MEKLKNLLLSNLDNVLLLSNVRCPIYGIHNIVDYRANGLPYNRQLSTLLLKNVDKIYFIIHVVDQNESIKLYMDEIKNVLIVYKFPTSIKYDVIYCNYDLFLESFPQFRKSYIAIERHEFLNLIPNIDLDIYKTYPKIRYGTYITSLLIIGGSQDLCQRNWNYMNNPRQVLQKELQQFIDANINAIIYVANDKEYEDEFVREWFAQNNISIYHYPIIEDINITQYAANNCKSIVDAADMLNELIKQNKKVYLHCYMGINRSVATAILYFIKHKQMSLYDAFKMITCRKMINIGLDLLEILYDHFTNNFNVRCNYCCSVSCKDDDIVPIAFHKIMQVNSNGYLVPLNIYDMYFIENIKKCEKNDTN